MPLANAIEIAPGVHMPTLAFGTFKLRGDECRDATRVALMTGFEHVDTASCYGNEADIRAALACGPECWNATFITSKIAPSEMQSEADASAAIEGMRERLGRAPDLVLVHWPGKAKTPPSSEEHRDARVQTWRALEAAVRAGLCRAIGVSNYEIAHLRELLEYCDIKPAVNQIELHPRYAQRELREYCANVGVHVVGYSPLGVGELLEDERVKSYADRVGLAPAPALVRWTLTAGCSCVVKSTARERTEENFTALSTDIDATTVRSAADDLERAFAGDQKKFCWDPRVVT